MKTIGRLYNSQGITIITSRWNPETQDAARFRGEAMTQVLRDLGMMLGTRVVARFSRNAGCSSCPCSPGFLLMARVETPQVRALALGKFRHANQGWPRRTSEGFDIWVDVATDRVEEFKGPREQMENPGYFTVQAEWKEREREREARQARLAHERLIAEVAWS